MSVSRGSKGGAVPRWRAGRKPVFVTVAVWQVHKGGYYPMDSRYGYVTTDEARALLRAVKPLTTQVTPWAPDRADRPAPATREATDG